MGICVFTFKLWSRFFQTLIWNVQCLNKVKCHIFDAETRQLPHQVAKTQISPIEIGQICVQNLGYHPRVPYGAPLLQHMEHLRFHLSESKVICNYLNTQFGPLKTGAITHMPALCGYKNLLQNCTKNWMCESTLWVRPTRSGNGADAAQPTMRPANGCTRFLEKQWRHRQSRAPIGSLPLQRIRSACATCGFTFTCIVTYLCSSFSGTSNFITYINVD